jgi:hypothetical protein
MGFVLSLFFPLLPESGVCFARPEIVLSYLDYVKSGSFSSTHVLSRFIGSRTQRNREPYVIQLN